MHNTHNQYGWLSIILHWLVALIVFTLFGLGFWMVDLDYYSTWYQKAPDLHQSIGICLFILMLFRVFWRKLQIKPLPLPSHSPIEKKLGHWVHLLLYLILFIIMVSGYLISTADGRGIMVFELFQLPSLGLLFENQEDIAGQIHEYAAYLVIVAAVLHALAALKHHFIDKDTTLKRMFTFK